MKFKFVEQPEGVLKGKKADYLPMIRVQPRVQKEDDLTLWYTCITLLICSGMMMR